MVNMNEFGPVLATVWVLLLRSAASALSFCVEAECAPEASWGQHSTHG